MERFALYAQILGMTEALAPLRLTLNEEVEMDRRSHDSKRLRIASTAQHQQYEREEQCFHIGVKGD